jgi:hypothetical protein
MAADLTANDAAGRISATAYYSATKYRENRFDTVPAGRLRLVHSAHSVEPSEGADRPQDECYGPVIRTGGRYDGTWPTPTEETTPA